jgi:hypothetical protein
MISWFQAFAFALKLNLYRFYSEGHIINISSIAAVGALYKLNAVDP